MKINVVYLAYFNESKGYDLSVVTNFLNSYTCRSAGVKHSLIIAVKNCSNRKSYSQLCSLAKRIKAKIIELPDDGWDLGAYYRAAQMFESDYTFYCGGRLKIRSNNWLQKLFSAFEKDDTVRIAGPTGSWDELNAERFPNYHIRTTAFMVKNDFFLDYISNHKFPETKEDTYAIEHGEDSLSSYALNNGHKIVVVNSDGEIFLPENWPYSKTYKTPDANKYLIEDSHITYYEKADDVMKYKLERLSWGYSSKKTKIKIFNAYHGLSPFFASDVFQPIYNGSNSFKFGAHGLRDNIGENISDKNHRYRELTGHYWVWKNLLPHLDSEYIGFCHHNKFLDFNISNTNNVIFNNIHISLFSKIFESYTEENILKCINGYDVVVPQKFISPQPIYELFSGASLEEEINLVIKTIEKLYPNYSDSVKEVVWGNELYSHLVFIMKKELVNEYMEWVFNILEVLEQSIDWNKYDSLWDNTVLINLAEALFNIWLTHSQHTKNLKTIETTSLFVDSEMEEFVDKYIKIE